MSGPDEKREPEPSFGPDEEGDVTPPAGGGAAPDDDAAWVHEGEAGET